MRDEPQNLPREKKLSSCAKNFTRVARLIFLKCTLYKFDTELSLTMQQTSSANPCSDKQGVNWRTKERFRAEPDAQRTWAMQKLKWIANSSLSSCFAVYAKDRRVDLVTGNRSLISRPYCRLSREFCDVKLAACSCMHGLLSGCFVTGDAEPAPLYRSQLFLKRQNACSSSVHTFLFAQPNVAYMWD